MEQKKYKIIARIIFVVLIFNTFSQSSKMRELSNQVELNEQKISQLNLENKSYLEKIEAYESENYPERIENYENDLNSSMMALEAFADLCDSKGLTYGYIIDENNLVSISRKAGSDRFASNTAGEKNESFAGVMHDAPSLEKIQQLAEVLDWNELYQQADQEKYVKLKVRIDKYEEHLLGLTKTYWATYQGKTVLLSDYRDNGLNYKQGDTVEVYGKTDGLGKVETKSTNYIIRALTDESDTAKYYPSIQWYY